MSFTPEQLKQHIQAYKNTNVLWVAYSGGCDSHVLLHSLVALQATLPAEIKAIHINHGLSPLAKEWEIHCQKTCDDLAIACTVIRVDVRSSHKTSPEEAARLARYSEWKKLIKKDNVILLGHHQDDQAETLLLQLLRGSGVKGLASMPAQQDFSQGLLCRPLLGFLREELQAYAVEQNLNWIDDPSNFDTDFDRNFLRHDVVPLLETRWPALKKTLSRTASHSAEADFLLHQLAEQDWQVISKAQQVNINVLITLDERRQRNVLRYWLGHICHVSLPDTVHLQRILDEVITAADDASPEVIWQGGEVRRFQGLLYAQKTLLEVDGSSKTPWPDLSHSFELAQLCLKAEPVFGEGLSQEKLKNKAVSIRFRQGGESCRPHGRGQTHQLKKLFQEWQVPPWLRSTIPLIYIDDELAEVVGYCRSEAYAASDGEASWKIKRQD